jgi:hypothetical protein
MTIFFMAQPVATMAETLVIQAIPLVTPKYVEVDLATTQSSRITPSKGFMLILYAVVRLLGYVWVFCWFGFIGWWFIKPYAAIGVMSWKLPFSFIEWAIVV